MERKLKSHREFSKGEKGRLHDVFGENISWVALAFDTKELEHAVVDGLEHDVDSAANVCGALQSSFRIRDVAGTSRIGKHRCGVQLGESQC